MKALVGRKIGMTSTISDDGAMQAITLLSVKPNVVTQIKSIENDGYTAYQVGTEDKKKLTKSEAGRFKSAKVSPKVVREFRSDDLDEEIAVGTSFDVDVFEVGDTVHLTGVSKGKGWAGTIKRHNFHRQRKTHGGKGDTRKVGSIGSMYPQHIFKGKKMAGQMGHEKVTIRGLKVAIIDKDLGVIGVTGSVPGPRKGLVMIRGAK